MRIQEYLFVIVVVGEWSHSVGKPITLDGDAQMENSKSEHQSQNIEEEKNPKGKEEESRNALPCKYQNENLMYEPQSHHLIKRVKKGCQQSNNGEDPNIQSMVKLLSELEAKVKIEVEAVTKYEQASLTAQKEFAEKRGRLRELNTEENVAKEESAASVMRANKLQSELASHDTSLCQARAQLNEMKTQRIQLVNTINSRSKREVSTKIIDKPVPVVKRSESSPHDFGGESGTDLQGQNVEQSAGIDDLQGLKTLILQSLKQHSREQSANLQGPKQQGVSFQSPEDQSVSFQSPEAQSVSFQSPEAQSVSFQSPKLQDLNLLNLEQQRAKLQLLEQEIANLRSLEQQSTNLQSPILQRVDLLQSPQSPKLQSTDLQNDNIRRAELQSVKLQSSGLQSAERQNPEQVFHRSAERVAKRFGPNFVKKQVQPLVRHASCQSSGQNGMNGATQKQPNCDVGHPCKTAEQLANEEREKSDYNKLTEQIYLEDARIQQMSIEQTKTSQAAAAENKRLEAITQKLDQIKVAIKHTQQDALAAWLRVKVSQEHLARHDEKLYQGRLQMDELNAQLTALRAGSICARSKRDETIKRQLETANAKNKEAGTS